MAVSARVENRGARSFSLIEMLAVVTVLALLVAIVVNVAALARRRAEVAQAAAELEKLKSALEDYRLERGDYPLIADTFATNYSSTNLLMILYSSRMAAGLKPFLDESLIRTNINYAVLPAVTNQALLDPWGMEYRYYHSDTGGVWNQGHYGYDLWSYGPDRTSSDQTSRADDLVNW